LKSILSGLAILAMIMAFSLSACSSSSPVVPNDMPASASLPQGSTGEGWLGLYQVAIHPDLSYDISPLRSSSAVGDFFFDLDLGIYLRGEFCPLGDCFSITSIGITTDIPPKITFDVSVKHPFGQYNPALPLGGKNRADLDVFDPKVVVLTEGNAANALAGGIDDTGLTLPGASATLKANFKFVEDDDPVNDPLLYGQPTDARLKDSAGVAVDPVNNNYEIFNFTKPAEFPTADMHPFKAVFNGVTPDGGTNNPTANDNRMSMGEAADSAHFELNATAGQPTVAFILGVSAAYGVSAVGKDNRAPSTCKYFPTTFRTPVATNVQVAVTNGTVGTSPALAAISIVDPQAGTTQAATWAEYAAQADGGTMFPPTDRLATVTFAEAMNIEFVQVSIPGLNTPYLDDFVKIDATSGNGTVANPWVFNISVPESGEIAGTYDGYVLVVDDVYDNDSSSAVYEAQAFVVKHFTVTFN
jgi:hypothetical protein